MAAAAFNAESSGGKLVLCISLERALSLTNEVAVVNVGDVRLSHRFVEHCW